MPKKYTRGNRHKKMASKSFKKQTSKKIHKKENLMRDKVWQIMIHDLFAIFVVLFKKFRGRNNVIIIVKQIVWYQQDYVNGKLLQKKKPKVDLLYIDKNHMEKLKKAKDNKIYC